MLGIGVQSLMSSEMVGSCLLTLVHLIGNVWYDEVWVMIRIDRLDLGSAPPKKVPEVTDLPGGGEWDGRDGGGRGGVEQQG